MKTIIPIIFDIETLATSDALDSFDESEVAVGALKDPEKIKAKIDAAKKKHVEEGALSPLTGRVDKIGILNESQKVEILEGPSEEEPAVEYESLKQFWHYFTEMREGAVFVGYNIESFDLPFLIRRSWHHQIHVPHGVFKGRFLNDAWFLDLRNLWTFYNKFEKGKLSHVSKFLGGPSESGDGAQYGNMTDDERREHLIADLHMTHYVYKRMRQ